MKKIGVLCAVLLVATFLFGAAGTAFSSDLLRERAKNLYSVQDYRGALSLFDRLLEQVPGDGEALDYSAWCLRYLGDWKSAEERFHEAFEAPSGALVSWLYVGLGETYLGAGDEKKSAESFRKAMEAAPQDEELLLRSLKGVLWAKAFLGDREEYEKTLSLLERKDNVFAAEVAADTASILEERERAFTEKAVDAQEPAEPVLVLDTVERQAKLLEDHELEEELEEVSAEAGAQQILPEPGAGAAEGKEEQLEIVVLEPVEDVAATPAPHEMPPCESSEESLQPDVAAAKTGDEAKDLLSPAPASDEAPAQAETPAVTAAPVKPPKKTVLSKPASKPVQSGVIASAAKTVPEVRGVRLGAPLEEELSRIEADGIKLDRENKAEKNGLITIAFVPMNSFFPAEILSDAASEFHHIEGFSGFVLKVQGMLKTKPMARPLEWKKNVFESMVTEFSAQYGKPTILTDQGTSSEAAWLIPDKRVLWIFADAGLDNKCSIQMSYVDRRIQAGYLINILK
jgi:tetratricopeptide (TPR) repeat protein